MSTTAQQNHERIEDVYSAFGNGDMETALSHFDEDIVWTEADGFPTSNDDGIFRGHDEVVDGVFGFLFSEFESFSAVPERFIADDDTVVAIGKYRGTHAGTGESFEARFVHVWDFEGEKVVEFEQIADTAMVQRVLP